MTVIVSHSTHPWLFTALTIYSDVLCTEASGSYMVLSDRPAAGRQLYVVIVSGEVSLSWVVSPAHMPGGTADTLLPPVWPNRTVTESVTVHVEGLVCRLITTVLVTAYVWATPGG